MQDLVDCHRDICWEVSVASAVTVFDFYASFISLGVFCIWISFGNVIVMSLLLLGGVAL